MGRRVAHLPDVGILLTHTNHDALMTWTTDNGSMKRVSGQKGLANILYVRKNSTGGIITYDMLRRLPAR